MPLHPIASRKMMMTTMIKNCFYKYSIFKDTTRKFLKYFSRFLLLALLILRYDVILKRRTGCTVNVINCTSCHRWNLIFLVKLARNWRRNMRIHFAFCFLPFFYLVISLFFSSLETLIPLWSTNIVYVVFFSFCCSSIFFRINIFSGESKD